jgi:hypothetical protein
VDGEGQALAEENGPAATYVHLDVTSRGRHGGRRGRGPVRPRQRARRRQPSASRPRDVGVTVAARQYLVA